tara:strand:- start:177 stop:389 length:213 start_codon:yes stop_codon:yes gene_type:complete
MDRRTFLKILGAGTALSVVPFTGYSHAAAPANQSSLADVDVPSQINLGDMWYNIHTQCVYCWNGSSWIKV